MTETLYSTRMGSGAVWLLAEDPLAKAHRSVVEGLENEALFFVRVRARRDLAAGGGSTEAVATLRVAHIESVMPVVDG